MLPLTFFGEFDEYYYTEEAWQSQFPDREYPREEATLLIAKHRNGPTGQVKLRFRHEIAKFENFSSARSVEEPHLL